MSIPSRHAIILTTSCFVLMSPWPDAGTSVFGQCAGLPAPPATRREFLVFNDTARNSGVAVDGCGRFICGFEGPGLPGSTDANRILVQAFLPDTQALGLAQPASTDHFGTQFHESHRGLSVALSRGGYGRVSWSASCADCPFSTQDLLLSSDFVVGGPVPPQELLPAFPYDVAQIDASAGRSDPPLFQAVVFTWVSSLSTPFGLV